MNEDRATRYNRRRRQFSVASVAWSAVLLALLAVTGASAAVRDIAEAVAAVIVPDTWTRSASVAAYVVLFILLNEMGAAPLALYGGYRLERQYGLSNQPLASWLADQIKALSLSAVLASGGACLLYACIERFPRMWWLPATAVFSLLIVGLANVAPLVLMPLFYTMKPLSKEALRARLVALGERAGARILDAYEWGLSEKSSKANAALTGLGSSRRILVSDTMLADYSDDEIEVVLAHEIGHHVHGDVWKGIAFETALIAAGFFASAWILRTVAPIAGLRGVDDVAGLPILLLTAGTISIVMLPAARALSRAHERRADRFALALTNNVPAFVSAMRRLAAQNLAEEEPSRLVRWLFHTHPPVRERIAAAQSFRT